MKEYIVKVYRDRTEWRNIEGELHREDGPAVKWSSCGTKEWYQNGKRHREGGPAVEWSNGSKEWWLNGKLHREDGPATEWSHGTKFWYLNGKLHREDGPAVEYADGNKSWYLNGKKLTEADFNEKMNSCNGKTVIIDGKEYELKLKQ